MDWAGKSHPLEVAAEWGAPLLLAGAAAWSASMAGLPLPVVALSAVFALAGGLLAMHMAGAASADGGSAFEPVALVEVDEVDELLLDDPLVELLLDDPLIEPESDSRVVRLFAREHPTPGELVLRISDYLNAPAMPAANREMPADQPLPDASAALHAALANIRASLR